MSAQVIEAPGEATCPATPCVDAGLPIFPYDPSSKKPLANWPPAEPIGLDCERGTGPAFVRLTARRVGYRRSAVGAWLIQQEQQPRSLTDDV